MGGRDRNNGSTNSRATSRPGGGEYRMVSADGGREIFGLAEITKDF